MQQKNSVMTESDDNRYQDVNHFFIIIIIIMKE